jgi:hypothetical protein
MKATEGFTIASAPTALGMWAGAALPICAMMLSPPMANVD